MTKSIAFLMSNSAQYTLTTLGGEKFKAEFAEQRYVHLKAFYQGAALVLLKREIERLARKAIRRNFNMTETDETPRVLSTLNGNIIDEFSSLIPSLYRDPSLCEFLSAIVGEQIHTVDDPGEEYVLNILHQPGDTHGAHIDTYKYTLITAIETPDKGIGGCLELVPNSRDANAFDDLKANIVSLCAQDGDCVLLDAGNSTHRVTPLTKPSRRIVIASAFANGETRNDVSYSSEKLYGG